MNLSDIKSKAKFYITGSSTEDPQWTDTDLKSNINKWYQKTQAFIVEACSDWILNGNWLTTDIVADQEEYIMPSNVLELEKVEINYSGNTNDWRSVKPLDFKSLYSLSNSSSLYTKVNPIYIKPDTFSLVFRPIPDTDVSQGIRIWVIETFTLLTEDTDAPLFQSNFHDILALGAAYDYCIANEITAKIDFLRQEIYGTVNNPERGMMHQIEAYYSRRDKDHKPKITPRYSDYR